MLARVDVAIPAAARLGEGPRWNPHTERLLWVDIEGRAVHVSDPATGDDRAIPVWSRVGCASWTTDESTVLVALADRLALLDLRDESLTTLVEVPHAGHMRTNDGICDPAGRFWVGSMALDESPGVAALYRYADGVLERVLHGLTLSNGIGWSPDTRLMYYVDSGERRLDVFDFDLEHGTLAGRREFAEVEHAAGIPDGLAVDDEGCVWLALWGGHAVRRYAPDGELLDALDVPAEKVTACCFGGADRRSLFITTAEPDGNVYVTQAGVSGSAARFFHASSGTPPDAEPASAL